MTTQWETVRIFISSTFDDMHAERDYLVKQVFPRIAASGANDASCTWWILTCVGE